MNKSQNNWALNRTWLHLLGLVLSVLLSTLLQVTAHAESSKITPVNINSSLGINTNEALEVNSSLPFVDLFRLALPFDEARPWFTKGDVKFDKNGWPKHLNGGKAGTRFLSHIPTKALPNNGIYTVLYEGEGKLRYGGSAKLIEHSPGKDLISIKPMKEGSITATLFIDETNSNNHLRNIRILMPGGICADNPFRTVKSEKNCAKDQYHSFAEHYQGIIFNPDYLNFMKDFKVVRFMNMSGVTRNNIRLWKNRAHMQEATWGGKEGIRGIPLELMVTLANRLKINPWFNIPHNADYNYILNFARFVKHKLDPNLKVYLEYSNETWNNVFVPQAEHMKQTGYKEKLDKNRNIAGSKYYALQSVRIFKIWEKELGGTKRFVRVLGGMTTDTKLTSTLLGFRNTYKHVDAVAIAPYFHIAQSKMSQVKSVNDVFTLLSAKDNRYSINNTLKFVKKQADITRDFGVDLIAYEGGQHLVDHKTHKMTEGATPHLFNANKDKRMSQAYFQLLAGWKKAGGKLFVAFSAPRPSTWHGSWGVKEYISQPNQETPKYRALLGFNHNVPCWWKDCTSGGLTQHKKPRIVANSLVTGIQPTIGSSTSTKLFKNDRHQHTLHSAKVHNIATLIKGTINDNKDLSGRWKASWDDKNLMLWVSIVDDKYVKDSPKTWGDDSIELYFDTDNSRNKKYDGQNDYSISFRMGDKPNVSASSPAINTSRIKHSLHKYIWGYQFTTTIPWYVLNVKPQHGQRIGFDIQVNDDDTGGSRDAKITWSAKSDLAWSNPQVFGELILVDTASPIAITPKTNTVKPNIQNEVAVNTDKIELSKPE